MAPTKPLVAQQIDACYRITGIPRSSTVELTGTTQAASRDALWKEKQSTLHMSSPITNAHTVFFMTPQVIQNDLRRGACPSKSLCLLVVDEAHRATGNYAYCEVVKELQARSESFRVLALTATPGLTLHTFYRNCSRL